MPMLTVDVPVALGERGYLIERNSEMVEDRCGFCGGDGAARGMDGTSETCPKCKGKGTLSTRAFCWRESDINEDDDLEYRVQRYIVCASEEGGMSSILAVIIDNDGDAYDWDGVDSKDVFPTRFAAGNEAIRRNSMGSEGGR
jgi:hypothetical protein